MENTAALTALIIDDEYDICFLLSRVLKNNHMDVEFVLSIHEGKSYLDKFNPNVLFLDNHLSDGLGMDFISYVKKNHPSTKIVMVSAHNTAEDKKKAISEGVDAFISKPFSVAEITTVISQVCPQ